MQNEQNLSYILYVPQQNKAFSLWIAQRILRIFDFHIVWKIEFLSDNRIEFLA